MVARTCVPSPPTLRLVDDTDDTPPLQEFLGPEMVAHMERIFNRPIRILGTYSQFMHNNWKLYMENVKDPYHASLLHVFLVTFGLFRADQQSQVKVDGSGRLAAR